MSIIDIVKKNIEEFDERFGSIHGDYFRDFDTPTKVKSFLLSSHLTLLEAIKEEIQNTPIEKAHTYASENADIYRAYDAGQEAEKKRILSKLDSEIEPIKELIKKL